MLTPAPRTDDGFTLVHHKKGPNNKHRLKALQNAANTIFETTDDDVSNDVTTNENSTDNDKPNDDNNTGDQSRENDITIDNNTNTDFNLTKCETTPNIAQGIKKSIVKIASF